MKSFYQFNNLINENVGLGNMSTSSNTTTPSENQSADSMHKPTAAMTAANPADVISAEEAAALEDVNQNIKIIIQQKLIPRLSQVSSSTKKKQIVEAIARVVKAEFGLTDEQLLKATKAANAPA